MTIVPAFRFACQRCGHCCSGLEAGAADARCHLGPARPLRCRIGSEPAESAERLQRRLRAIERETGYPASYGRFAALISARRNGIRSGDETRTR